MTYKLTTSANRLIIDTSPTVVTLSLSRTGGQGTRGDSLANPRLDDNDLLIDVVNAAGTTLTTVNAGSLAEVVESVLETSFLATVTVSSTPPVSPSLNDLWIDIS